MAHKVGDLVKENATAGGTGAFAFGGAPSGFTTFAALLAVGDTTWYRARNGGQWEIGLLTRSSSTSFTRSVRESSASGSVVNFSAAPEVICTVPSFVFNVPVFRAYRNGDVTGWPAGVYTKVLLNAESFDPDDAFDSTTNYRFEPGVPGWYHLSWLATATNTGNAVSAKLYRNGVAHSEGGYFATVGNAGRSGGSDLVYLGATDYVELMVYMVGGGTLFGVDSSQTYLSGHLVRAE